MSVDVAWLETVRESVGVRRLRRRARSVAVDRHWFGVGGLAVVAASVYALFAYLHFRQGSFFGWDLGIFDQIVRDYAHFRAPDVSTKRHLSPTDTGVFALADHFSPILIVLAPMYWIDNSAFNLLFAQAVLFAAAVIPVWIYTRRKLGVPAAYCVAVAFLLYWPLQSALDFDFHEVAFAPLILATLIERVDAGRWRHAAIAAGALLMVKEDMAPVLFMVGVWIMIRGHRRIGAYFATTGAATFAFLIWVVMPAVGGSSKRDWYYAQLGSSFGQVAVHLAEHPSLLVTEFIDPHVKLHTAFWLFVPVLFLCLRSWIFILAVPQIFERAFSNNQFHWVQPYHYNAYLAAILVLAGVEGASRFRWPKVRLAWAVGVLAIGAGLLPFYPLWQLTSDSLWRSSSTVHVEEHLLSEVPEGSYVMMPWSADPYTGGHVRPVSIGCMADAPEWMLTGNLKADVAALNKALPADQNRLKYVVVATDRNWTIAKLVQPVDPRPQVPGPSTC
jgi:uncharacterized membrane protein